jgi:hypothetical protein
MSIEKSTSKWTIQSRACWGDAIRRAEQLLRAAKTPRRRERLVKAIHWFKLRRKAGALYPGLPIEVDIFAGSE